MPRLNPENEMAKRAYLAWLKNANGRDASTLDQVAAAINAFEAFTRYQPFKGFRREKAVSFKEHLVEQRNPLTGRPLSKSTLHSRLYALKAFFEWLSREPGYRKGMLHSDAAYFGLSTNDVRVATARREGKTPSLAQILDLLDAMPGETAVQRRDRAVVAFTILSGARDNAIASMRLKHIDVVAGRVTQDAREVRTKNAKTFTSLFIPVGDRPRQIVEDWIAELENDLRFGPDDPLFPATRTGLDQQGFFTTSGLTRETWTTAAPIRAIFKAAFTAAGMPYFTPHSFRRTLMAEARRRNLKHRELKAWSQNLGHSGVLTSLLSYGEMTFDDQADAMASMAELGEDEQAEILAVAAELVRLQKRHKAKEDGPPHLRP